MKLTNPVQTGIGYLVRSQQGALEFDYQGAYRGVLIISTRLFVHFLRAVKERRVPLWCSIEPVQKNILIIV